ncbi:hypothetical protein FOMG_15419 [Fusarium oxysporum f. sp. melonis 26406]|uniref:HNH nuclease domain-containing protein n=1 Tax=Fusarium oxysporum f. sp. melonis 26406 TaxID=1089452 RepID=X0A5D6_FUSOX|nr:hypothetical protein FOMG_15419 [Fusarium oxysporum f. sp. melonis 26406]
MDATNIQRRDALKVDIDQRFQGVVSDRAYNHLREVVRNHEDHPFQVPSRLLDLHADQARDRRRFMGLIRATIRAKYEHFELELRHFVVIMMVDPEALGPTGPLSYGKDPDLLLKGLNTVYGFQRHFMQQKAPKENQSDDSQDIVEQYKTFSTVRKTRSDKEKKACKKRDGQKCMVTETAHPHACHIVPFAFNSSEANTEKTKTYIDAIRSMFGKDFYRHWGNILADPSTTGRGASDKVWNMLCLSPQLHDWWGRGYFAFKLMSSETKGDEAAVVLQFHWMPKTTFKYNSRANIDVHWAAIESALRAHHNADRTTSLFPRDLPGVVQAFLRSGERLATGHLFLVKMATGELDGFEAMITLQWVAIQMLAICGGAGDPELLGQDDDDDTMAGALVSSFNASVQSHSRAPSHASTTVELREQLAALTI